MKPQQLDEEAVFHVARELHGAPRVTYLDQICAGDAALRERVDVLLDVYEKERDFLKSNDRPAPTIDQPDVQEQPGQQIGRYKLLQRIGEGGFGVVYMAEQQRPVRRKVALKIIKPGMDTRAVVARFEAERQALAMMDHPNIARILDGGMTEGDRDRGTGDRKQETDAAIHGDDSSLSPVPRLLPPVAGRPYFVMELVKGVPITEYCDKNNLPTEDRLKLFSTVCQAVQHAHQKGIIHRDLKPSNVLVTLADGQPIVKVIDFGVAKATNQQLTEKTLFTAYGQMVGTPQYMSPEQAEMSCLDVDTRSDVYSLGVLLYELLTGTTPVEAERLRTAGFAEMQRIIREEEPQKPSTRLSTSGDKLTVIAKHRNATPEKLKSQIAGDLDSIVMKALEKDRNRGYESPNSLARDVSNYLESEPVDARPPTLRYRAAKYLRRHRVAVAVAGLVFASLSIGLVGTAWNARRARLALASLEFHKQTLLEDAMSQTTLFALQGNLEKARTKLETARALGADPAWCMLREGQIALQDGNYEEARSLLHDAETMMPKNTAAHSLSIICDYFAGFEHSYLLQIGSLKDWPATDFEDYLFRGLAQTWAHPQRAVQDLKEALSMDRNNAMVHLLLASALRLLAADTPDPHEAYGVAKSADKEAFIAKEMLGNSFSLAEYIHAQIVLANICRHLGPQYLEERNDCIAQARLAVDASRSLPYDSMAHLARVQFYNQCGTRPEEADELFTRTAVPEDFGSSDLHSDIVFRRSLMMFRKNDLKRAREEFDSLQGTFAHRTNLTLPALIDMTSASRQDLERLQRQYKKLLVNPERDKQGIFAHHDWAVARLIKLDEVAHEKGEFFHELALTLHHDFTDEFVPLARFMRGEDVAPELDLRDRANSNRLFAETYFSLGVDRLARGDREGAKRFFQECLDTDYYTFFVYWWSQAFLERIDDDAWLPWLNEE